MKTFDDVLDAIPSFMRTRITNVEYLRGLLDGGYGQHWRKYHNYEHICQMLGEFHSNVDEVAKKHSLFSNWEYIVAILFHDVVYDLGAHVSENEENSIEVARTFGPRCIQVDWKAVEMLIRATIHDGNLDHPSVQFMADLDLSTFGSLKEFPLANARVRAEYYQRYPTDLVLRGRLDFLKKFEQKPFIFYLKNYFDNGNAFANIAIAIKETEELLVSIHPDNLL